MAGARLRFQPPSIQLTDVLRWMLRRAFGPAGGPAAPPDAGDMAAEVASTFALSPRIAARTPAEALERDVGSEAAAVLRADRAWAVATDLRLQQAARCLRAVSERLQLPVVFLKFAALRLSGAAREGVRGASDTDVLVPDARSWELHRALVADGFEGFLPDPEHHLPPLSRGAEGTVEIHRVLLGVRAPGSRQSMGYDDLAARELLQPLDGEGICSVPARSVLAAHALVHGLVQHGSQPDAYPIFAVLGDLVDLGLGSTGTGPVEEVLPCVASELDRGDVDAVAELCRRLRQGEYSTRTTLDLEDPSDRLLAHALAGRLDEDYARGLKLDWLRPRLSDRPYPVQFVGTVARSLFPSRARLFAAYGSVGGPWALVALRVRHLYRVAHKLGQATLARLRWRRPKRSD